MTNFSAEIRPGATLKEKYRIEARLGAGGMAEVFRARNTAIDRTVAIKVLNPALAANPEAVQRFKREAKAANRARHPNIVDVLDVDNDGDVLFIVQEYLEGEDLASRLQRGRLPVDEALDVLMTVAQAVAVAHGKGVIHRDLKPANVFLSRVDGQVVPKILDFGISKMALNELRGPAGDARPSLQPSGARITLAGSSMGTPYYMSPEQIRDPASVDPRTDVWSLGIILYEALAGSMPFDADDLGQLFAQIHTHEPRRLDRVVEGVSVAVAKVVQRCLRVAPGERYASAAELASALSRARGDIDDEPTRPPNDPVLRTNDPVLHTNDPVPRTPSRAAARKLVEPPRLAGAADATAPALGRAVPVHSAPPAAAGTPVVSSPPPSREGADAPTSKPFLALELDLPQSSSKPPAAPSRPSPAPEAKRSSPVPSGAPTTSKPPSAAPATSKPPAGPSAFDDDDDDDEPLGIGAAMELAQAASASAPPSRPKPRIAATADRPESRGRVHLRQHGAREPTLAGAYARLFLAGLACAALALAGGFFGPAGMAQARQLLGAQVFWGYAGAAGVLLVALGWTGWAGLRLVSFSLFLASAGLLVTAAAAAAGALWIGAPGLLSSTIVVAALVAGPWASCAALVGYALFALSEGRERYKEEDERLLGVVLMIAALLCAGGVAFSLRRPHASVAQIQSMPPTLDEGVRAGAARFARDAAGGRSRPAAPSLPLRQTRAGAAVLTRAAPAASASPSASPSAPP